MGYREECCGGVKLHHPSIAQYQDTVTVDNRVQPVGNGNGRAVLGDAASVVQRVGRARLGMGLQF